MSSCFIRSERPLTVEDFDYQIGGLCRVDTESVIYDFVDYDAVLRGLRDKYAITDRYKQGMLYDHAIADPDASICDPVLARTHGRPTGTTPSIHLT